MTALGKRTRAIYARIAKVCSQDVFHSIYLGALIQSLTYLHSLSVGFFLTFPFTSMKRYKFLPAFHYIIRLVAIFPYFDVFASDTAVLVIWGLLTTYFLTYIAIFICLILKFSKGKALSVKASNYLSVAILLHSQVLFFPFHYFLLEFISKFSTCSSTTNVIVCNPEILAINIILVVFNVLLSFCKEISFYQILKGKSSISCKTNIVAQLILLQKTIITFLFVFLQDSSTSCILIAFINLITYFALCSVLYFKLPWYKIQITQVSMIFSGLALFLSVFSVLKVCNVFQEHPLLEYILFFGSSFTIKILLQFLKDLDNRIFRLEIYSPEQAIHLPILLSEAMSLYSPFPMMHNKFNPRLLKYCSLLKSLGIDISFQNNHSSFQKHENKVYMMIIEKFNLLLNQYPKSEVLRLCMAQIYVDKLKSSTKSISLIRSIASFSGSIPIQNSVEFALQDFEKIYLAEYQENNQFIDSVKYFEYRNLANRIKSEIQHETSKHIEFWRELKSEKVDALKMILISEDSNRSCFKIKNLWNKYSESFRHTNRVPALLYGIYLETARDLSHEAWSLISNYFDPKNHKTNNKEDLIESVFTDSASIILASTESEKLGKIIDTSASVKSMFNVTREHLLGQKVDVLMPNFIARRHDEFIKKYNNSSSFQLNREFNTIAKTSNGNFFSAKITLKVCPLINNGVCVMGFIKKISENEKIIIIGNDDIILDHSCEIEQLFKLDKAYLNGAKLQQLCPELTDAFTAFNLLYKPSEKLKEEVGSAKTTSVRDTPRANNLLILNNYSESEIQENSNLMGRFAKRKTSVLITESQQSLYSPFLSSARNIYTSKYNQDQVKCFAPDKETAFEICQKYKEGVVLTLGSLDSSLASTKQTQRFQVTVEPLLMEEKYYKVVKIKQCEEAPKTKLDVGKQYKIYKTQELTNHISPESERILLNSTRRENLKSQGLNTTEREKFDVDTKGNIKTLEMKHRIGSLSSITEKEVAEKKEFMQNKANEASSVKGNFSIESKVMMKTLNNVLAGEKVRLTTKISLFIIYFVILAIILLTVIDYTYTGSSINDTRSGALIIDTASKRLYHNIILLQYIIGLFSSMSINSRSTQMFLQSNLYQSTMQMIEQNDILKIRLQEINNINIKKILFKKRITLWDPSTLSLFNSEKVDSFTASHMLANKNVYIAKYTGSSLQVVNKLTQSNDLVFVLNNTLNDYFVTMEQEIKEMEQVLEDIVSKNISILKTVLSFENIALLLFATSLSILLKVVLGSHRRMFKAILAISQNSILQRIKRLEAFQTCLKENIELKKFSFDLNKFLEASDKLEKQSIKKDRARYSESRLRFKGLVIWMLRYYAFSSVIILSMVGIFISSYLVSVNKFTFLSSINNKLSVTHKLGYQIDNILSNLGLVTALYNRTNLKIRNEDPNIQFAKNLEVLSQANIILIQTLLEQNNQYPDSVIENFLKNDMCTYLKSYGLGTYSYCISASKNAPGLLSLNARYLQDFISANETFSKNVSSAKGDTVFNTFITASSSAVFTLQAAYDFLTKRLLNQFEDEVECQKTQRLIFFVSTLIFIVLAASLINRVVMNKFKSIDIAIRRVLRMIPYEIIKQNKVIGFFLINEFKKEVEGIKKYL